MRIGNGGFWAVLVLSTSAHAQGFQTGQRVYATPSGADNDWYAGCVVRDGRSNNAYRVECAGTTYWVDATHISLGPSQPQPDSMRPGRMSVPKIVNAPSAPPPAATAPAPPAPPVSLTPQRAANVPVAEGPGNYAVGMEKHIADDRTAAESAALKPGTYPCDAMGRYTFSDLIIHGAHAYTVEPGGSGNFNFEKGVLTFLSGPYAGAYARMVDGTTVGISAKGNTDLGTQCGLKR